MTDDSKKPPPTAVVNVEPVRGDQTGQAAVTLKITDKNITFQVTTEAFCQTKYCFKVISPKIK